MKYIAIVLLMIFITGCSSAITKEEIAEYKEFCKRETTTVVEPERTVVIESCLKDQISEERKYIRAVREEAFLEEYYLQKMLCTNSGGVMIVERRYAASRLNMRKPPTKGDRYGCMSAAEFSRTMQRM